MIRFRLLPIVIAAGSALIVLKTLGLMVDGGYILLPDQAIAQEQPADAAAPAADKAAGTPPEKAADDEKGGFYPSAGKVVDLKAESKTERAVLERLGDRRKMLERRQEELDLREQLLKAAESRLEKRIGELKALETKIDNDVVKKEEEKAAKLKDLVKMYESMKAKSAARIFDRLDLDVLVPVAKQMKPRKLADVMARMKPETAERLTVALADIDNKAQANAAMDALPKIQGNTPN